MRFSVPFLGHGDRWINLFGHPYFIARFSLRSSISELVSDESPLDILDVGCGNMPYKKLFPEAINYCGLEIDQPRNHRNTKANFFYDGMRFPFASNTFDSVLCSQVLEHSFTPELLLQETCRVLRPGGTLFLTMPFLWPEHEQPYDSQRFTSFGLANRLEKCGFEGILITKSNVGISVILQLLIEWLESLARRLLFTSKYTFVLWRCLMVAPYSILNIISLIDTIIPGNTSGQEFYLDLVVRARKPCQ